ncbi:MAG: FAD-dependent oxidoreductase [Faecalibacillus faecis]
MHHFDEKIAIIGAGPAGLTAAFYLAETGYRPTVFEKANIQEACYVVDSIL